MAYSQECLGETGDSLGWDGPYLGVVLGGKVTNSGWQATGADDIAPGHAQLDATAHQDLTGIGVRAGIVLGYTWQLGNWVLGPDADFAFGPTRGRFNGLPGCAQSVDSCNGGTPPYPANPMANDFVSVRTTWDANLRARVGYLVTPGVLLFAAGGLAVQEAEVTGGCGTFLYDPLCAGPPYGTNTPKTQTNTDLQLGWTAGAGLEARLDDHWHLRTEYRYARFAPSSGTFWAGQPAVIEGWDAYHYKVSLDTHVSTLALTYRF